ncbi:DUF2177 family protein [Candidatus Bipolaricaulota bacterium]|nr:DUF2177 family protein [Candidatus Bipolaricaulota bacterium]
MDILRGFYLYLICLGTFLAIDFTWLGLVAREFYRRELGELMSDSVNWTAAFVFYLLFVVGIIVFVVNPAVQKSSLGWSIGVGFLFGVIAYATYDLTNLATLAGWSLKVTVVDMIWGGVLSATVSLVGYLVGGRFLA